MAETQAGPHEQITATGKVYDYPCFIRGFTTQHGTKETTYDFYDAINAGEAVRVGKMFRITDIPDQNERELFPDGGFRFLRGMYVIVTHHADGTGQACTAHEL